MTWTTVAIIGFTALCAGLLLSAVILGGTLISIALTIASMT